MADPDKLHAVQIFMGWHAQGKPQAPRFIVYALYLNLNREKKTVLRCGVRHGLHLFLSGESLDSAQKVAGAGSAASVL